MINFNPIRSSIQAFVTLTCVFYAFPLSFSLSLSPTKVTTTLSKEAISIPRCTKHEQRSHIYVVRSREQNLRLPGLKRESISGGATESTRVSALPRKNHAWSKGLTIPELDFNTLYFMSSFFFLYIFSYRICRYTFLANSKKLIPK